MDSSNRSSLSLVSFKLSEKVKGCGKLRTLCLAIHRIADNTSGRGQHLEVEVATASMCFDMLAFRHRAMRNQEPRGRFEQRE